MDDTDFLIDDDPCWSLEDELLYGSHSGGQTTRSPEKRLDSPILDGILRRLYSYVTDFLEGEARPLSLEEGRKLIARIQADPTRNFSGIVPALGQFLEVARIIGVLPQPINPKDYPDMFSLEAETETHLEADTDLCERIFGKISDAYVRWVSDVLKPREVAQLRDSLRVKRKAVSQEVLRTGYASQKWSRIVDAYRRNWATRSSPYKLRDNTIQMYCCKGYLVIENPRTKTWSTMVYEQAQMIQDACLARHNTYVALHVGLHNGTAHLTGYVTQLLAWNEACLRRYGNDGFELIKAPEALFKTWLTRLTNGDILAYSSYDRTIDKLLKKEGKLPGPSSCISELDALVRSVADLGDCVELFGLIKLSGHPIVYAEKSAAAVRTEAQPKDQSSPAAVLRVARATKHMILSAYIDKHGEWPPLSPPPRYDTTLRRHFLNRVTSLPLDSYPMSDLDEVEFGQFLEFDYSEDFLKFLDDKAICPGADEIWKFWWPGKVESPRRLLLKALSEEKIDMKELVERMRRGRTSRNEEVVELTQKERELKNAARCFCKLVFPVRCFFTLTEYNLGESLMSSYLPQQTMTMSEEQTKQRLYAMAYKTKRRENTVVEVDFSRWNLRWRSACVNMVGRICERIYGLPGVFSQAHPFFSRSTIVLTDKHALPQGATPHTSVHDWPDSELVWRNHLGGFEGIIQKLWTICTVAMIYTCVWDIGCTFLMAGQGDNQVLVFSFPAGVDRRERLVRILATMEIRCKQVNQLVKPDECIDSTSVLTYSKEIYVAGVHRQYTLKFISRSMQVHDSDIPSLSAEIAGTCSSAVAVANTLPIPLKGFWWQMFRLIRLFREHMRFSAETSVANQLSCILSSKTCLQFALLLPGSLGGLPVLSWGRYLIRGEVDELSWDIASTLHLQTVDSIHGDLALLLERKYTPRKPDLTALLNDPLSISVIRPKDQTRLIREHLERQLPLITRNSWLYEIITTSVGSTGDALQKELCLTKPFYPVIMSDLFKHSLAGLRLDIYGRFNMTRTIADAVGGLAFAREISRSSGQLLAWIRKRYDAALATPMRYKRHTPNDTFRLARQLRSFWGPGIDDSTTTTYNPLAARLTGNIITQSCISAATRTSVTTLADTVGPYPPNFGTKTKQKRSEHGYKILLSSDTVSSLRSLVLISSQINAQPRLRNLIDQIIRSRSAWGLDQLEPVFPSVYGGVAAHRHDAIQSKHFGVLGSQTVPTHLSLSSDNSGCLKGGEHDYPFVFQEFYLTLTSVFQSLCRGASSIIDPMSIGLTVSDMVPLPAEAVELSVEPSVYQWRISPTNSLAYATTIRGQLLGTRPPASIIPPRTRPGRDSMFLASYLLSKSRIKTETVIRTHSTILFPIEHLDIAELNGISSFDLINGMAIATAIETAYHLIRAGLRVQVIVLPTTLTRIALAMCDGIARMLLMQESRHMAYLHETGLLPPLGLRSLPRFVSGLAGHIAHYAGKHLLSDYILTLRDPFILFADTTSHGVAIARKLASFVLLQVFSTSRDELRVPAAIRRQVFDGFYVMRDTRSSLRTVQYGIELVRNLVQDISMNGHGRRREKAAIAHATWPKLVWDHRDADEARRDLRRTAEAQLHPPLSKPDWIPTKFNGRVAWRVEPAHLGGIPYPVTETVGDRREIRLCLDRLVRPIGVYTSAYSIWLRCLSVCVPRLRGHVLSVGVGNGAVALASLAAGASKVTGVDLHTALPAITQREFGLPPPEVAAMGSAFKWADEVFTRDQGDWLRLDHERAIQLHRPDAVIVDIEVTDPNLIVRQLPRVGGVRTFLRVVVDQKCLCWLIDCLQPTNVTRLTSYVSTNPSAYLIEFTSRPSYPEVANPERIVLTTDKPLRPSWRKNRAVAVQRLNRIVSFAGIMVDDISKQRLQDVQRTLTQLSTNHEDERMRTRAHLVSLQLRLVIDLYDSNVGDAVRALITYDAGTIRACTDILSVIWPDVSGSEIYNDISLI